jgi:hypothetical protein
MSPAVNLIRVTSRIAKSTSKPGWPITDPKTLTLWSEPRAAKEDPEEELRAAEEEPVAAAGRMYLEFTAAVTWKLKFSMPDQDRVVTTLA